MHHEGITVVLIFIPAAASMVLASVTYCLYLPIQTFINLVFCFVFNISSS